MPTAMLKRTVKRLAALAPNGGGCWACANRPHVCLREGQEIPTCPVCNSPLPAVRLIRDEDFYHNADRLREIGEEVPDGD